MFRRLEDKQREVVQSKIAVLEESESVVRDYSWLTNAQSCLFRTRRVLAYSYAFAFYMFGSDLFRDDISTEQNEINQNLFEDHQQQLEATVERLAKLVETPFDQVRVVLYVLGFQASGVSSFGVAVDQSFSRGHGPAVGESGGDAVDQVGKLTVLGVTIYPFACWQQVQIQNLSGT